MGKTKKHLKAIYTLSTMKECQEERQGLKINRQLRALMSKSAIAEEEEKRRIAEYIHNNISQNLAMLQMNLGKLQGSFPAFSEELKEARGLIEQAIKFIRPLTFELGSPILFELGITTAVEWLVEKFAEKYGIIIEFKSNDYRVQELDEETGVLLFSTIRELLNNIVKHAGASRAKISVCWKKDYLDIEVEDDGGGVDVSAIKRGVIKNENLGMLIIRERIKYLKGAFKIKSELHEGTKVKITLPLNQ